MDEGWFSRETFTEYQECAKYGKLRVIITKVNSNGYIWSKIVGGTYIEKIKKVYRNYFLHLNDS